MNSTLRRSVLVNLGRCSGLILLVGLLIGGSVMRLSSRRARIASQEREIEAKREALEQVASSSDGATRLKVLEAVLIECREMAASEANRIAALSAVASDAGVALLSLKSSEPTRAEDGSVVACTHRLDSQGTYRQLAHFFEGLYAARGMASIDELEIERDESDPEHLLRASLAVTWHAADPLVGESGGSP